MICYPGRWILEIALELGIPIHLASDAHHPNDILGGFEYASRMLSDVGYKNCSILHNGYWDDFSLIRPQIFHKSF